MAPVVDAYIKSNQDRLLDELKTFLRIPSISTLPQHRPDIDRAGRFVAEKLQGAGLQNAQCIPTAGHPLVYGEWMGAPGKPTVLCYGHYDVQPPDPLDEWKTPPFEPDVRDGNIYARGAADDKCQMYTHVKALEALLAVRGALPVNAKFLIEGEEEVGGAAVDRYVRENAEALRCDVALVSDTEMFAPGLPTLCVGLRGLVYAEITASGAAQDLHSGIYGGAAPNPLAGLTRILSQLVSADYRVQIPGFYDDVEPPSAEERASWAALPFSEEEFRCDDVRAPALVGEAGYGVLERRWARPTLEIHGFIGGFQGEGAKTVIPAKASVKVSMRLVPRQDPQKILAAFKAEIDRLTPPGLRVGVRVLSSGDPMLMPPSHPYIQAAARALTETFGGSTVFIRGGGSIPIVARFQDSLKVPAVLMGFGLPDDRLHSPNEKFYLPNFYDGIRAVARFWDLLGELPIGLA
jgi:acetylornithine deacetylase/succinyl-diaminopimelate desuccinylase-like protein